MDLKGQSSMEFLAFVSISALMLAALTTVMVNKRDAAVTFQNSLTAERIAEYTSFQVELALVQGDGYSRVFSVPESLAGKSYTVTVVNGSAKLEWGNKSVIQSSRYRGEKMNISTSDTNTFLVYNSGGEVNLVEK